MSPVVAKSSHFFRILLLLLLSYIVAACSSGGDGGGGGGNNNKPAPVANADSISVDEGGTATLLNGGASSVLVNDTGSDPLTAVLNTNVSNGNLTFNADGTFSYTHNGGETTSDSFTYHSNDGTNNSNVVTVTITITPLNDAPVAVADSITVSQGGTATSLDGGAGSVLLNDTDVENDTLTAVINTNVSNGSLTLNADGTFSYTHNGGTTTSDSFTYHANDGSADSNTVTVTIAITPNQSALDLSGVWMIDAVVTSDNPVGCKGGAGATGGTVASVTQSSTGQITIRSYEGETLTGTINTATGGFSAMGTTSRSIVDLSQPTSDTAFINWGQTLTINGALDSATTFTGSITTSTSEGSSVTCTSTQSLSGTFVYQHTGLEDYSGVYAFEYSNEEKNSDGTSDYIREGFPFEIEISGSTIEFHLPDEGSESQYDSITFSNVSFDPDTGYFTVEVDEVERWDNVPQDGIIDGSEKRHYTTTGIFMDDPAANGSNGAPLVIWASKGYTHFYNGDINAGAQPFASQDEREVSYGKRLVTQGMTRTFLVEKGDQTNEPGVFIGLHNPPLKRVSPNSALYIEVVNQSGAVLCSAPYIFDGVDDGRYFEQINMPDPDFNALAFRGNNYSSANCNTSSAGVDQVVDNEMLTVRVLDTGPNGIKETTSEALSGDDVIAYSTSHAADVVADGERLTETPSVSSITVNGARASTTLDGNVVPLFGYFDAGESIPISWSAINGADRYQVRLQGTGVDDFVKYRYGSTSTNVVLPANAIDYDEVNIRLVAIKNSTSNGAQAMSYSRRLNLVQGIRGMFNVELGDSLPLSYQTFQVYVEVHGGFSMCLMTSTLWPLTCQNASIDFVNDTVTLTMQDVDGTYTNTAGNYFDLIFHFNDSATAEVTSPDGIAGVPSVPGSGITAARVVNPEFYLRTERMSHNGTQRTRINVTNSFPALFTQAVLSRVDGGVIGNGLTSLTLWNDNGGTPYADVATEFTTVPTNDGHAQTTKVMASFQTNNLGFGNIVLASGLYKLELTAPGGSEPAILRYNYTAPNAANYIAPDDTSITLDGTDCSVTPCNNPATPITVSNTPDISWAVNTNIPTGSYWRIVFRPTNATGDAATESLGQIRTPFMADGIYGLSIAGGVASWTNPGSLVLPSGNYEVQLLVLDSDSGLTSTVLGVSTGPSGVGNDLTYITVP